MQVRRFCDEEALPQIDNLALPLAAHRSLWGLLFVEPGVLKIYFSGRSKDQPLGIGCDCCMEIKESENS
jgi:hypothetical protein